MDSTKSIDVGPLSVCRQVDRCTETAYVKTVKATQQEDTFSMMVLDKINQVVWEPFHKTRLHIHHVISRGHYVSSYKLATVENEPFQSAN